MRVYFGTALGTDLLFALGSLKKKPLSRAGFGRGKSFRPRLFDRCRRTRSDWPSTTSRCTPSPSWRPLGRTARRFGRIWAKVSLVFVFLKLEPLESVFSMEFLWEMMFKQERRMDESLMSTGTTAYQLVEDCPLAVVNHQPNT